MSFDVCCQAAHSLPSLEAVNAKAHRKYIPPWGLTACRASSAFRNSTANRLAIWQCSEHIRPSPGQPKELGEEAIAPMTSGYHIRMKDASCAPAICFTDRDKI